MEKRLAIVIVGCLCCGSFVFPLCFNFVLRRPTSHTGAQILNTKPTHELFSICVTFGDVHSADDVLT